jgi:hypothetical protein
MKRIFVTAFLMLSSLPPIATAQEPKAGVIHLPGGGVTDAAGKVGFFPNKSGGIDALDLATGKLLWASKEASRPLAVVDNRLIAQSGTGNQVRFVVFDTANQGKAAGESKPVKLPDWVAIQTQYGRTFQSNVRTDGAAMLYAWEARAFYAGGAAPTPEIEEAARKHATGVIRIDPKTGQAESIMPDKSMKLFPLRADVITSKVGMLTLSLKDGPAQNPKNRFEMRRTLQAMNQAKELVWQYDIAAPVFLPPPP